MLLYTTHIPTHNTGKYTTQMHVQKQATLLFKVRMVLLTSDFGSSTQGERQFLLC